MLLLTCLSLENQVKVLPLVLNNYKDSNNSGSKHELWGQTMHVSFV